MITALSGTRIERNTTISSRNDKTEHDADEDRQVRAEEAGQVDEGRGDAADVHDETRCPRSRRG